MGIAPEKLVVIHNGIEIPESYYKSQRLKIRKKHSLKSSFTVGAIGFFRRNKGFDLLLKAAKIVHEKKKSIKFILVETLPTSGN